MHIEGPGPTLSCDHATHSDEQLLQCLAREWNVTVPQLVAMLAALVFAHTERTASSDAARAGMLLPLPVRACEWCSRPLPAGTHHSRRYCPDTDCKRLAYNAWQRAGRPSRSNADR
jgi:hypothetical protein